MSDPRRDAAFKANELAPFARDEERRLLLDALRLEAGAIVLEVGAWDGYLASQLVAHDGEVILLDRIATEVRRLSAMFHGMRVMQGLQERIPILSDTVNRVASLVALHHINTPMFLREARRVLRDGGRLALVEVGLGSRVAKFLDTHVNAMTKPQGHRGIYFSPQEWRAHLTAAGFVNPSAEYRAAHWRFSSMSQAIEYCRLVFGLNPSTTDGEILVAIETLDPVLHDASISWEWPLVVATGDVAP